MTTETILSVGIDIGTSTTQVIFSRIAMENTSGFFTVPHVSIVKKEVVYKSPVYTTPLKSDYLIDTQAVRDIVAKEFASAGYRPSDTGSGAVIITGESARKENSDAVLESLSSFAGDFVVSAAGPDMESVIAGKGSGAYQYSIDQHCCVANLDVGGGTTNIVVFNDGEVIARGCLDIGGRLIRIGADGIVTKVSPAAAEAAKAAGITIQVGSPADAQTLGKITDQMALALADYMDGGTKYPDLLKKIITPGSSILSCSAKISYLCFSGGVADAVYNENDQLFPYGDIGILLGNSIKKSRLLRDYRLIPAGETIRATVVGAGTYTTTVSGSTITYSENLFPLKNIPVLRMTEKEQEDCFQGEATALRMRIRWFLNQNDEKRMVLAMEGKKDPSYSEIRLAAECLSEVLMAELEEEAPLLLVISTDIGKALGQLMRQNIHDERPVIAIDRVHVEDGDFVDMGKPILDGLAIPIVVKTLIFG
ncbi:MAG: ethanolamine ammonia-lyase reactivating factor EutA [Lachnospiraceae bacterium]|nr:ethanolamine ammonia-lyase reactivating factor EutA [Lachnospiraceae bacterium]